MTFIIGVDTGGPWDACDRCGRIIPRTEALTNHGLCDACGDAETRDGQTGTEIPQPTPHPRSITS